MSDDAALPFCATSNSDKDRRRKEGDFDWQDLFDFVQSHYASCKRLPAAAARYSKMCSCVICYLHNFFVKVTLPHTSSFKMLFYDKQSNR